MVHWNCFKLRFVIWKGVYGDVEYEILLAFNTNQIYLSLRFGAKSIFKNFLKHFVRTRDFVDYVAVKIIKTEKASGTWLYEYFGEEISISWKVETIDRIENRIGWNFN